MVHSNDVFVQILMMRQGRVPAQTDNPFLERPDGDSRGVSHDQ
jgi:hypothetical protein